MVFAQFPVPKYDRVATASRLGANYATGGSNLLTNGGFEVVQRGAGPWTATNTYTADRWGILLSGTSTMSVTSDTTNYDAGSRRCLAVAFTLGSAPSDIIHRSEDYWQVRGKTVSFSMRVRSTLTEAVRLYLSDGLTSVFSAYHSGSGLYETLTMTWDVLPGSSGLSSSVQFYKTGTYYLDNAMLVPGDQPQDYVPMQTADDLAQCQRYYETLAVAGSGSLIVSGMATAATQNAYNSFPFKSTKAVTPTVTIVGTWGVGNSGQPATSNIDTQGLFLYIASSAAGTFYAYNNAAGNTMLAEGNP